MTTDIQSEALLAQNPVFKTTQLITEQTWDAVSKIAKQIDESLLAVCPSILIGSELTFFSIVDVDLDDGEKIKNQVSHTQKFMDELKSRFAPNNRVQYKKRIGIFRLEWKHKSGVKKAFQAFVLENGIKVTLPDIKTWEELSEFVTGVYEAAGNSGLSADKYNQYGAPYGSGLGCKIIISGDEKENSPFLERSDLLMSMVTYWQNHPSLSYIFSPEKIGPMGHAPRVDEVRNDVLYELEIASRHIPKVSQNNLHPEIIDQIFRHKLTDRMGKMGGAEISIEKLYPVDRPEKQLGIVELRCFEMVPDAKLHLLQHLLIRAIMARCIEYPYREQFINWGTALQHEFMLPYFLELDFQDVLLDLEDFGYTFQKHWFAAQFARRFPQLGRVTLDDAELYLSIAMEPMNILFDENAEQSSNPPLLQRLQFKTSNLDPERHVVTCNGFLIPLTEPDDQKIQVAAIRLYKTLPELPSKEIMKRTPNQLTFELIDKHSKTSLGGFIFKIPTSEEYKSIAITCDPIEARQRRTAAFDPFIPYGGEIFIYPSPKSSDNSHILDLRIV